MIAELKQPEKADKGIHVGAGNTYETGSPAHFELLGTLRHDLSQFSFTLATICLLRKLNTAGSRSAVHFLLVSSAMSVLCFRLCVCVAPHILSPSTHSEGV